jgi:hypothetical protein
MPGAGGIVPSRYHRAGRDYDRSDDEYDDDNGDDESGERLRQKQRDRMARLQAAAQHSLFQSAQHEQKAATATAPIRSQQSTVSFSNARNHVYTPPANVVPSSRAGVPRAAGAVEALHTKIDWCTRLIAETDNLEEITMLATTINALAKSVQTLNNL